MRGRLARRVRRRLTTLALSAVVLSFGMLAAAAPAHAYSCTGWQYLYTDSGPAAASFWLSDSCSDGLAHYDGTVYDEACDSKGGHVQLYLYQDDDFNATYTLFATRNYHAGGGCGTSTTYAGTANHHQLKIKFCVNASSTWSSTTQVCKWVYA
jgi:hypothetical protein